jgi:hypothetical protein
VPQPRAEGKPPGRDFRSTDARKHLLHRGFDLRHVVGGGTPVIGVSRMSGPLTWPNSRSAVSTGTELSSVPCRNRTGIGSASGSRSTSRPRPSSINRWLIR